MNPENVRQSAMDLVNLSKSSTFFPDRKVPITWIQKQYDVPVDIAEEIFRRAEAEGLEGYVLGTEQKPSAPRTGGLVGTTPALIDERGSLVVPDKTLAELNAQLTDEGTKLQPGNQFSVEYVDGKLVLTKVP